MVGVRCPIEGVVYPSEADIERYIDGGALGNQTMVQAFAGIVSRFPNRPAIADTDTSLSFAEIDRLTDQIAAGLLASGIKPLDRATFQIPNGIELVLCLLACLKAGIIPLCTLTAHRRAEIGYLSQHAEARVHFISTEDEKFDFLAFSNEIRKVAPSLELTVIARGNAPTGDPSVVTLDGLKQAAERSGAVQRLLDVDQDPFQVAIFQLSGGTSGTPKIIPRFHNEYLYQLRSFARWHGLNEKTVAFSPAPMMHNAPIVCYWGSTFWSGGQVVCIANNDPSSLAQVIRLRRPNWMNIPLPLLIKLKNTDLIDREIFSQARMLAPGHAARVGELTGARVFPSYGMTEGIISSARDGDPSFVLNSTVGRPTSSLDEFRIIDPESRQILPVGELGEFCFKGPTSSRGYFKAKDRNKEAFTLDGFCLSGDLMRLHVVDGQTFISFEGRVKDVVSRGGEKINCQEVERTLVGHPGIGAIAIVPMPDPIHGEKACAFVIPGRSAAPPSVKEVGEFLEQAGLAKFKWPERIEVVKEFPLTSSGKVSKPLLKLEIVRILRQEARPQA